MSEVGSATQKSEFARQLSWKDGVALALVVPVAIFAQVGPSLAAIGSWAVIVLFAIVSVTALLQNRIFSEMATMFPDKPGGIALYAHEAWRRYFSPLGALAALGYWAAWAFANAVFALTVGALIQGEFFSGSTWTISTGSTDIGLSHVIGIACLVSIWLINVFGIRPTVKMNKVLGALSLGLILVFFVGPFVTGSFDADGMTWGLGGEGQAWGGWRLALVFLFLFGWTAYSTEICATFSPEFRDPERDTAIALKVAGLLTLAAALVVPLGLGGTVGDAAIAENTGGMYAAAFDEIVGPASGLVTLLVCGALYLVMNSCTADAGRALFGIAKDKLTIKQLDQLNSKGVPSRAMGCDLAINVLMIVLIGNPLGIIFASNIGYFTAIVLALAGFILLRRDRPDWPRPIRLGNHWVLIASALCVYNIGLLIIGTFYPGDAGYGGLEEQLIAAAILGSSFVLFVVRRVVQDRGPLRLREETPHVPSEAPPPPLAEHTSGIALGIEG